MTSTSSRASDFWIYFHGRSGSSWLRSMLNGYADTVCAAEIFQANLFDDADGQMHAIREHYSLERGEHVQAVGSKTKGGDIIDGRPFAEFIRATKMPVVLLRRRDVVKQAVSLVRGQALFERDGVWNLVDGQPPVPPITVDPHEIVASARSFRAANDQLGEHVYSIAERVHEVWYEDLVADVETELAAIRTFLGLGQGTRVVLDATFKNSDDNLEACVSNFDALVKAIEKCDDDFDGTEWLVDAQAGSYEC